MKKTGRILIELLFAEVVIVLKMIESMLDKKLKETFPKNLKTISGKVEQQNNTCKKMA